MTRAYITPRTIVLLLALVSGCAGDKVTGPEDPGNGGGSVHPPVLAFSDTSVQFPGVASGDGESELRNVLVHNRGADSSATPWRSTSRGSPSWSHRTWSKRATSSSITLRLDRARYTPREMARALFSSRSDRPCLRSRLPTRRQHLGCSS